MVRKVLLHSLVSILFLSLFSLCITSSAFAFSGSGSGTSGDPYQITSCSQLQEISNAVSSYYKQKQNIDCNGVTFSPLASSGFSGTLDGQGYTISNITINGGSSAYQALFQHTEGGAVIKNVHINGGSITTTGNYAATFVGYVDGTTTIQDSSSSMTISAANGVGGFIGTTNGSFSTTITRSSFTGNLTASATYLGGFIAVMLSGSTTISDSYTTGTYTGTEYVGGLVGYVTGASISTSYSSAAITVNGSDYVGGLAGIFSGTISNSFSAASVGGTSTNQAGIAGSAGTLTNVYYDIYTSGQSLCTTNSVSCTGVNSGNSNPNYFKNNKTNPPLNVWNFSGVWARTNSYPVFGTDPGDSMSAPATSSSTSQPAPVSCTTAAPATAPNLFHLSADGNSVTLYLAPVSGSNTGYVISYGQDTNANSFATQFNDSDASGVIPYTIHYLYPGTWYFKVRGQNGCMPGNWSQVMQAQIGSSSIVTTANVLGVSTVAPRLDKNCTDYTVMPGDTLWTIAQVQLGSGVSYPTLMQENNLNSSLILPGQIVKIHC